jgi:ferric-dicitrate binding protein FerR (iron transport regulator)
MDISTWTIEDFVFDPGFRKWLFSTDSLTNLIWEEQLAKYPHKIKEVMRAREMLVHLNLEAPILSEYEKDRLWNKIEGKIALYQEEGSTGSSVPPKANSSIRRMEQNKKSPIQKFPFYRVVAILLICFGMGFLARQIYHQKKLPTLAPTKYTAHDTRPGVKSKLTLTDGTRVMLNSGSELYYEENFSPDKRELYLFGEAYFEVFPDAKRPFVVRTGEVSTTALGTSFGIQAQKNSLVNVYLLSGEVLVADASAKPSELYLKKGEAARMNEKGELVKSNFDEEQQTAWTRGVILFNTTPIMEALHILENWYGVKFDLINQPDAQLKVSGKFDNEILQNILLGLSYSARFQFDIQDNKVKINFIHSE